MNIEPFSSDYDEWSDEYTEQKALRRKSLRELKESNAGVEAAWAEGEEGDEGSRSRKSKSRRRDIEDRLERRRLRREIYDDYGYDYDSDELH